MTPADHNIKQRKTEIQLLIGADHIPKAIKRLMDFSTDFSEGREDLQTIIHINAELSSFNQQLENKTIEKIAFEEKRTGLAKQLLELVDKIENDAAK